MPENIDITSLVSVPELQKAIAQWGRRKPAKELAPTKASPSSKKRKTSTESTDDRLVLPNWLVQAGNRGLNAGQRALYERVLKTRVSGKAYLPVARQFIVAANHSSHLDMGLVKHALGDWGDRLVALAAKDYFFDDPLKRVYFENFTNLIPMDRTGSLRESLRLAARVIEDGFVLLIFPEGTRSEHGVMQSFKASIGYLALHHEIDVLPMYLEGTHDAMPKGDLLPKQGTKVAAHIGPVLSFESLQKAVAKVPRTEQNREAARLVEIAVRKLAPEGPNRKMPTSTPTE